MHDVHRFLRRRTRDDALADDLTAHVFERCWQALPTYEPRRTSMRPWLLSIAANAAASHYRSDARRRERELRVAAREPRDGDPTLEPTAERTAHSNDFYDSHDSDDGAALLAVLADLPARHQEVLTLRFLADLSTEEAAAALGVSRGHFAVLQFRAAKQLRAAWQRDHDGSSR